MDVIFSSYFVTREDPQRHKCYESYVFSKMEQWYESVNDLGLNGVIFCDCREDDFIGKYETENIKFEFVQLGSRSVNDERFYIYYNYLKKHPEIERVFMTDLFDVQFFRNPFGLFEYDYKLYIGDEQSVIGKNDWLRRKYREFDKCVDRKILSFLDCQFGRLFKLKNFLLPDVDVSFISRFYDLVPILRNSIYSEQVLNAGIIGGGRSQIMSVIERMLFWFDKLPAELNMNMPVLNLVVRDFFDESEIMHGYPLNTLFKGYEKKREVYIKHK